MDLMRSKYSNTISIRKLPGSEHVLMELFAAAIIIINDKVAGGGLIVQLFPLSGAFCAY
jgi:hypothetical protein